jgi:hypothetical protein
MYLYFSSQVVAALGRADALPFGFSSLLRAQTEVTRKLRPVTVVLGIGICLLSQAIVIALLADQFSGGLAASTIILFAELAASGLWTLAITVRWSSERGTE